MTTRPAAGHLRAVATLVLCLVLAGGALGLLLLGPLSGAPAAVGPLLGHPVPWWALLLLYAGAELVVVHVQARRETLSVSFSHVVLVVGLVGSSPSDLLVASVLGRVAVLVVVHHQRGTKLVFNAALFAAEAAVAATCFRLLLEGAPPLSGHGMLAALAAVVVADLVSAAALTGVVALAAGDLDAGVLREAVTSGLVIAVANTSVGLLLVVVLEADGPAVALIAVVVAVLALGYRGWTALSRTVHRLEALHHFTRRIGRAHLPEAVREAVLREARDVMATEAAELVLLARPPGTGARGAVRLRLAGEQLTSCEPRAEAWWAPAAGGTPVRLTRRQARVPGPRDGLAAPVEVDGAVVAVLLVLDRVSHLDDFTPADLRLFTSLTDQAGAALHTADLMDRVRRDAEQTEHRALHCTVTGLPNRGRVATALDAVLAAGGPVALCLLDLRGFGDVNHAFGHATGDLLLAEAGRRLADGHPGAGLVGRVGNDEFAVVLPGAADEVEALAGAEAVVRLLDEPFEAGGAGVSLSADVGVALARPGDVADASVLLERADAALCTARGRDGGGGGSALWDSAAAASGTRRLLLVGDLREAIARRELAVHYQPKVDPRSGATVGAEALVRWQHPALGAVSPDEFVPLAEHAGLVGALTSLVLDAALAECARWRREDPDLCVAVNLSARSLLDEGVVEEVRAALERAGLPAGALVLEVTETAVMTDLDRSLAVLHRLSALDVRVSIDDFGTGQASLAYLRQLPADELKIDRTFVRPIATDARSASIVRSAVDLAHALGLSVVAEGVEDEEAMAHLARWGCDAVQGYLVSRPVPAEAFRAWLRTRQLPQQVRRAGGTRTASGPARAR